MSRETAPQDSATALRLPRGLLAAAATKAREEGVSLSELMRGALRREISHGSN